MATWTQGNGCAVGGHVASGNVGSEVASLHLAYHCHENTSPHFHALGCATGPSRLLHQKTVAEFCAEKRNRAGPRSAAGSGAYQIPPSGGGRAGNFWPEEGNSGRGSFGLVVGVGLRGASGVEVVCVEAGTGGSFEGSHCRAALFQAHPSAQDGLPRGSIPWKTLHGGGSVDVAPMGVRIGGGRRTQATAQTTIASAKSRREKEPIRQSTVIGLHKSLCFHREPQFPLWHARFLS